MKNQKIIKICEQKLIFLNYAYNNGAGTTLDLCLAMYAFKITY